jgi:hypothetical protein
MQRAGLVGVGIALIVVLAARAQQWDAAAIARELAARTEDPSTASAGTVELQVLDWRTGAPLPDAVVVVGGMLAWPWDTASARDAVASGQRIALDADARARVPARRVVFAGRGDALAMGSGGCLVPIPEFDVRLQRSDAAAAADSGWWWGIDEAAIRQSGARLGTTRWLRLGMPMHEPAGALWPGAVVVDALGMPLAAPLVADFGPRAALVVVGMRGARPAALGRVDVRPCCAFAQSDFGTSRTGGDEIVFASVAAGLPLSVSCGERTQIVAPLAPGERRRVTLELPAPVPMLRYRLVDPTGRALRLWNAYDSGMTADPDRSELLVAVGAQHLFVRLRDDVGEDWSCAPFVPPVRTEARVHDEGELVLHPSSRTEYCRGRVFDAAWQPVRAAVSLTDGNGVRATAATDDEGRFRVCIGPWFTGPISLGVPGHHLLTPLTVARGDDVVLVVGPTGPSVRGSVGITLLGLPPVPMVHSLEITATPVDDAERRSSTSSNDAHTLFWLLPGRYHIAVASPDGRVSLAARNVVVRAGEHVAPPELSQPLPSQVRAAQMRFVGADGAPCPIGNVTQPATARWQVLVAREGETVSLPGVPWRGFVRAAGDTVQDVVLDFVVADLVVAGLPTGSEWQFGLAISLPDAEPHAQPALLRDGAARVLVARGTRLRAHLFAHLAGRPVPSYPPATPNVVFERGGGEFVVGAGRAPRIGVQAPRDLYLQLQALREAPAPSGR